MEETKELKPKKKRIKRNVTAYILFGIAMALFLVYIAFTISMYQIKHTPNEGDAAQNFGNALGAVFVGLFAILSGIGYAGVGVFSIIFLASSIKEVPKARRIVNIIFLALLLIAIVVGVILLFTVISE